ncbi:MAG: PIN domain-containing protein [Bacteroidetes bacterium]|nr:MAG: PIN domain-containing protein [Bacteroidota bacterium]
MLDYVVDANVLMSVLISQKASYKPILTHYNFIFPDFVLLEIEKYKTILKQKTNNNEDAFLHWSYFVFSRLTILPQYVLTNESIEKSKKLLEKIDPKDTAYVALAMQLDLPLLTRDIILYNGLRKQGFRKIILFNDFLNTI